MEETCLLTNAFQSQDKKGEWILKIFIYNEKEAKKDISILKEEVEVLKKHERWKYDLLGRK